MFNFIVQDQTMFKQVLTLLLLLCFLTMTYAQDRVSLFPYWKKGDVRKLLISEGFIDYEDDKVIKKEVEKNTVIISVKNETDTSYLIEWKWTEYEIDRLHVEVDEEDAAIDSRIEDMFEEIPILFEIDESGNYKHIVNYEELIKMAKDSLTLLMMEDLAEDETEEDVEMMMELILSSDLMRDQLEREIYNYHYYFANTFPTDTIMEYQELIENEKGLENIPATGIVKIFLTEENMGLHINDTKTLDSKALGANMLLLGELIEDDEMKDAFSSKIKNKPIEVRQIENYTYNFETGWLKLYEHIRVQKSENKRKESFLRMEGLE